MREISALYRYPVKGLSAQPLTRVAVKPEAGFPKDRFYAFSKGTLSPSDYEEAPRPKTDFLMLLLYERLARLDAKFDDDGDDSLSLRANGELLFGGSLTQAADIDRLEQAMGAYMRDKIPGQPKLLRIEGRQFTDVAVISEAMMRAVSIINLKSVRTLEEAVGLPIDPLRFRANIYFEGDRAWEEFDWIGKTVRIGPASAVGILRTKRCGATNVNPVTSERDRNLPAALVRAFNHSDMGIYVEMKDSAQIAVGDVITVE